MLKVILVIFGYLVLVQTEPTEYVAVTENEFGAPFCTESETNWTKYEENIIFYVQNEAGIRSNFSLVNVTDISLDCAVDGNYTILIHGWEENITTFWADNLINSMAGFRKGCIFFMDYGFYSKLDYFTLLCDFDGIQYVLTKLLKFLESKGFNPDHGWLFGFSYGAHLAFEGAYQYGEQKLARIDCCDPAGPGFTSNAASVKHANVSAKAVQCVHTSGDLGTIDRYCNFDMNMGYCGFYQPAATAPPVLSHGLCPVLYNNSFTFDFQAVKKPDYCVLYSKVVDITNLPKPIVMGARFNTSLPYGEYYFPTTAKYPYN